MKTQWWQYLLKQTDILLLGVFWLVKQYWFVQEMGMVMSVTPYYFVLIGSSMMVLSFLLFTRGKVRISVIVLVDLISSFILLGNILYYRYFGDLLSVRILGQAGQVGDIKDTIFSLVQGFEWLIFATLPILAVYTVWLRNKGNDITKKNYWLTSLVLFLVVFVVGMFLYNKPIKELTEKYGTTVQAKSYSNLAVYRILGINGYHGFDLKRYWKEDVWTRKKANETENQKLEDWFAKKVKNDDDMKIEGNPNLIVIQWEALQNVLLNAKVNGQEVTPNLNKFVEEHLYFDNIYDQSAQGRTSDAEIMVNASLHPLSIGSVLIRHPKNNYETLANTLGYDAYSFHGNNSSFWNRYVVHNRFGFDTFYSIEKLKDKERIGPFLSDKELFSQSVDILKEKENPFYAYLITVSSHHPFYFPEGYEFDTGEHNGTILGAYLKSNHYVDEQFGMFLERLKEEGLYENSIIAIYGDHNAEILFNNEAGASFINQNEGKSLEAASIDMKLEDKSIPLILRIPSEHQPKGQEDQYAGKTIHKKGGLIDVAPTILSLYGKEPKKMMGSNLLDGEEGFVTFRYGESLSETHYNYEDTQTGDMHCYNLSEGEEDPNGCKGMEKRAKNALEVSDLIHRFDLQKKSEE